MKENEHFTLEFDDIPAIVGTGFMRLRRARYSLLHIQDPGAALEWLQRVLACNLVHSLVDVRGKDHGQGNGRPPAPRDPAAAPLTESVTLGFSYEGLMKLGLAEDARYPFPSAFRAGMASALRRQLLGDAPEPAWRWGDVSSEDGNAAHIFVAHYWDERRAPSPELDRADPMSWGMEAVSVWTCPSYIDAPAPGQEPGIYEPFGFRDGIGQPLLRGLLLSKAEEEAMEKAGKAGNLLFEDRQVWPGEFVLGHRNEYGESAYCPNVTGWPAAPSPTSGFGRNGSYLVVRQIEQHVQAFGEFERLHPLNVAELMVGRRKDGSPLLSSPERPSELDAFRYLRDDADGFQCPRGAHARRAHPRDTLAHDVDAGIASSKLHRLLRRGRVYTEACTGGVARDACGAGAQGRTQNCGEGLMFLALNADFERQFEFVQRSWIAGSRFGNLSDEQDPILGTAKNRSFSMPGCPVGTHVGPLPRFTTLHGGGYFFVPGLNALQFIAASGSAI